MAELNVRSSAATAITKLETKLEAGQLAELDLAMKRVTLENLEGHFTRFMDAHFVLVGSSKGDEFDAHTTLFDAVEEKYTKVKARLLAAIELAVQEHQGSGLSTVRSVHIQRGDLNDVRLEKITIPEFHGEFNKWIAFRDMFEAMVHSKEHLSTAAKYTRLMKALKGTAAQVVAGFLPTDENYESAWQTLKARYDNDRLIVSAHLNIFLNMESLDKETNTGLRRVIDLTNETTRSLAAMKRPVDKWDDILVHILVSKLPRPTIIHWEMQQKGTQLPKLVDLLGFIEGRARGLDHMGSAMAERTNNTGSFNKRSPNPKVHTTMNTGGTQRLLRSNLPTADRGHCYFCNGDHFIGYCPALEALSPAERFATAILLDIQGNPITARALCDPGSQITFITERCMQQLRIKRQKFDMVTSGAGGVEGPTTRGVAKLQLQSQYEADFSIRVNAFVLTKITANLPTHRIGMNQWHHLKGLSLADPKFGNPGEIDLLIGSDIWGLIIKDGLISGEANQPHAQNTHLGWVVSGPVDLIHCNLAQSMQTRGNENLEEALTRFWQLEEPTGSEIHLIDECERQYLETVQRQEDGRYIVSIPFLPNQPKLGDSRRMATQQFYRNERRLHSDPDLLAKYVAFMNDYAALGHMMLYEDNVQNDTQAYYIPHHAVTAKFRVVFNASAKTDNGVSLNETQHIGPVIQDKLANIILRFRLYRVAIVADIEKMFRQVLVDPKHQKWQLILWRENPNEKLKTYRLTTVTYGTRSGPYLAVRTLHQCARDNYTIIKPESEAIEAKRSIEKDFYVDDYLSSAPSPASAIRRSKNVDRILRQGHMHLRKWQSNKEEVVKAMAGQSEAGKPPLLINTKESSVLGLQWDSEFDMLSFEITLDDAMTRTKRKCLSDIAKLYDPTGLLAPVVIKAKIFMQRLWLAGISWDEELPGELLKDWFTYRQGLFELAKLAIPRHIGMHTGLRTTLHGFCDASIHAYAAAIYVRTIDEVGKATVRLLTSKTRVAPVKTVSIPRLELCGAQLLVTTMNTVREALEMLNVEYFLWTDSTIVLAWLRQLPVRFKAYVANRVSYVQQNSEPSAWHHIPTSQNPADCASRGLTASQLQAHTLWWTGPDFLQRDDRYSTKSEPLCSTDDMKALREEEKSTSAIVTHTRIHQTGLLMTRRRDGQVYNILERTNSLTKLKRIMAHVLYALYSGSKKRSVYGSDICSVERLHQAMLILSRLDQMQWYKREIGLCDQVKNLPANSALSSLNPFIDEDHILRVGGRIKRSTLDANQKYPIILSREGRLAHMIVSKVHEETLHGGVQLMLQIIRQTHWIIGGRALIKSYVHKCVTCRLQRGVVAKQRMGDLPKYRVTRHRPFLISGVDFCGPFLLRLGVKRSRTTTKTYAAIFVCLATKAVHIELATDLSTEAFLNAFARFTSRRGPCEQLHSDNGTNFQGANRRLQEDLDAWQNEHVKQQLAHRGTTWHFIPPAAPHQGGIWEAAVKSVKRHIVRVVGNQIMSYEQFNTLLIRIEACLNSRPLIALYDDPDDKLALTPADFLTGGPIIALPEPTSMNLPLNRIKEWHLVRRWTEEIWQRWHQEYLTTLQQRSKWRKAEENVKIGDIVAIKHDNLPPTQWCIGRITAVHPGEDQLIRVVTTQHYDKITGRTFSRQRPIQKICILYKEEDSETTVSEEAGMSEKEGE